MDLARTAVETHEILIEDTGERFHCLSGENVLKAMERLNRRGIPVGCRGGGCGVCKIRVSMGPYVAKRMSRAHVSATEEVQGIGLACCVIPTGDLSVSVLGQMRQAIWQAPRERGRRETEQGGSEPAASRGE